MSLTRRPITLAGRAVLGVALLVAMLAVAPSVASAAPVLSAAPATTNPGDVVTFSDSTTTVEVNGHGWGHGIGMGQWGSYGYATQHGWTYTQILDHYYGGTTMGTTPDALMTVQLMAHVGKPTYVFLQDGQMSITDLAGNPIEQRAPAIRFTRIAPDTFEIADAPSCSGPWTVRDGVTVKTSTIKINPSVPDGTTAQSLGICLGGSDVRWYRGEIRAVADPVGIQRTVNALPLETYLRGVVPRESPASWGNGAGGKGMHALRTQAVAARTYTVAENRYSYARTCDTTACHVYSGRYVRQRGTDSQLEHPNTDQAITDTAGQIRVKPNGSPAYTQYSSSTGGHTAFSSSGGFPAVPDEGDSVSPRHTWTTNISRSAIEAKYGRGSLQSLSITARNGLGADGGRVQRMRLVFSGGTLERTGNDFRRDFGLYSDWFSAEAVGGGQPVAPPVNDEIYSAACRAEGQGDLQRLYTAYFLRLPDDGGWNHWVASTTGGQSLSSISGYFAGSPEFRGRYGNLGNGEFVDLIYQNVLARTAEPTGRAYWLGLLDSGRQGRGAVMLNFSNSAEYKAKTGNCS
ncbi:MAG: DUF4214 domain-containing protein [Acidimicrobiia bacterium]|nr:DUF4214 domain-containing protein [Acidimicrobiia bacterium]